MQDKSLDILLKKKLVDYQVDQEIPDWTIFNYTFEKNNKRKRKLMKIIFLNELIILFLLGFSGINDIVSPTNGIVLINKTFKIEDKTNIINSTNITTSNADTNDTSIIEILKFRNSETVKLDKMITVKQVATLDNKLEIEKFPVSRINFIKNLKVKTTDKIVRQLRIDHDSILYNRLINKPTISRFSYSVTIGPNLFVDHFKLRNQFISKTHEDYEKLRLNSQRSGTGLTVGFLSNYSLNKLVSLHGGLLYSEFFEVMNYNYINYKIPVIDSITKNIIGYLHDSSALPQIYYNKNRIDFLSLPIFITLDLFSINKLSFKLGFGSMLSMNTQVKGKKLTSKTLELVDLRKKDIYVLNSSLISSFGMFYQLNNKMTLGIAPIYTKFFNFKLNNNNINDRPYSVEIKMILEIKTY